MMRKYFISSIDKRTNKGGDKCAATVLASQGKQKNDISAKNAMMTYVYGHAPKIFIVVLKTNSSLYKFD